MGLSIMQQMQVLMNYLSFELEWNNDEQFQLQNKYRFE